MSGQTLWRGLTVGGVGRGLGAVLDAEFGENRADVVAYGLGADAKDRGDVGVAMAPCEQGEHVAFAAGQPVWVGAGVGAARAGGAAAGLCEALTGSAGRGAGAQPSEGGQGLFDGSNVAAELGQRGVVRATEGGPCGGRGAPVTAGFQPVGRYRVV